MIHPHTEIRFISREIGYGVVATEFIPKGTITWALDTLDREFTQEEVEKMDSVYQDIIDFFTYRNNKGNYILCWDHGRYVNHSFNSNCLTTAYDFEVAIRDIQAGEQLTDDYGYLNISRPFRAEPEGTKRKIVYPDDLVRYHRTWDKKLHSAFKHVMKVEQPLKKVLSEENLQRIKLIDMGAMEPDSILNCYYKN